VIHLYVSLSQCIGRVIRHNKDWGTVFLLDDRYVNLLFSMLHEMLVYSVFFPDVPMQVYGRQASGAAERVGAVKGLQVPRFPSCSEELPYIRNESSTG
jgi:hypothetical protein